MVGGGNIATRRVVVLLEFTEKITVISPDITDELSWLCAQGKIRHIERKYQSGDLKRDLIIAATNDRKTNKEIAEGAKAIGIICNVADAKDECGFWFPAIVNENGLIAGVISEDGNHKKVKVAKQRIKSALEGFKP